MTDDKKTAPADPAANVGLDDILAFAPNDDTAADRHAARLALKRAIPRRLARGLKRRDAIALIVLAPRKAIPVHAFENYVLGSGEASTSMGLNGVASLGKTLRDAPGVDVQVLALPAHFGGGTWSADQAAVRSLLERLRAR